MKKAIKIICRILNVLLTLILLSAVVCNSYILITRNVNGNKNVKVFGFSSAVVLTGSMYDVIEPNDIVIARSQNDYQVGDIIMFDNGTSVVTHRIVKIQLDKYVTKGDANNVSDKEPVSKEKIIGRVILIIPKMGVVLSFFQTPVGMLSIVLGVFLLIQLPAFVKSKTTKEETENAKEEK